VILRFFDIGGIVDHQLLKKLIISVHIYYLFFKTKANNYIILISY